MVFLLLYFVILIVSTTMNTQDILEPADSSSSTVQITVPYYLWVGTEVTQQFNINITAPQNTSFYGLMQLAEAQNPEHYRKVGRVSTLAELGGDAMGRGRFGLCHCVCHQEVRKYTLCSLQW